MKMNMRRMCVMVAAVLPTLGVAVPALAQVTIDWVTVGNAGNPADPLNSDAIPGIGSVGYEYRIGTYLVTNSQYAVFLNAVAASDPNGLYNDSMNSNARGGITRSGTSGSYTYAVRANMGDKPASYVSWYDAARFCNWMTNGQGSGGTESGVYTLTGPTSISGITRDLNNPDHVFMQSEDEWYKAAYHQPASQGGDADDYWLYATQSNTVPTLATATSTGDVANPGQDVVNYFVAADWNGQNGNVTTVGSAGSTSFYGAFDMNGNVFEWNEALIGSSRGIRGGSFGVNEGSLRSSARPPFNPVFENNFTGFRLTSPVPEPGCRADFNGDGVVNILDVVDFISNWNTAGPASDFNGDGNVNVLDVVAFITVWNNGCP